jgi:hypothetical protein
MAPPPSRITEARRRAAYAKQAALSLAAAGFLAIALLARVSHPAHASTSTPASTSTGTSGQTQEDDGFSLQPGQLGQSSGSQGAPQTSVS